MFDEFFALQDPKVVNGAVLFFPKGDPAMLTCLEELLRNPRPSYLGSNWPAAHHENACGKRSARQGFSVRDLLSCPL